MNSIIYCLAICQNPFIWTNGQIMFKIRLTNGK
nr:MAG TPA: hypothetical protein [Caudoviricetes sp.]